MTSRDSNRATYPEVAAARDMYAAAFGEGVRVKAFEVAGQIVGTFSPGPEQNPLYAPKPGAIPRGATRSNIA